MGARPSAPDAKMTGPDVAKLLATVAKGLPGGGEPRQGQTKMAEAVQAAISDKRHLLVQAGTGTGKSLAYLVPAVSSGRRVVVATASKALQDQLAQRDLPLVAAGMARTGKPVTFVVLKGRGNYFCVQKGREVIEDSRRERLFAAKPSSEGEMSTGEQVSALVMWSRDSESGDRATAPFEPSDRAWSAVSATPAECPGAQRCAAGSECFAERARRAASEADVVVVNTHLYSAHIASGGAVLPDHDVLVVDEAHELEDIASAALGVVVSPGRVAGVARAAWGALGKDTSAAADLSELGDRMAEAIKPWAGRRLPAGLPKELAEILSLMAVRCESAERKIRSVQDSASQARKGGTDPSGAATRALVGLGRLREDVTALSCLSADSVAWVDVDDSARDTHGVAIRTAPIEVGPILAKTCWSKVTAVLTSATMPKGLAGRVGLDPDHSDELDVGSPFDYAGRSLLYCAAHLPDRRKEGSDEPAFAELERLIRLAGGRTLALFTSYRAMSKAADALSATLPYRIVRQGEMPKAATLEVFTSQETSCLFATMGFWQGIDVPGSTCSLVVIDRLPFPRPDDVLLSARRDRVGSAAFGTVDLPRAATMLAQGAGRLIRSANDRGVVAVLDARLASARYRWALVDALPPMRRTRHISEVEAFLAR